MGGYSQIESTLFLLRKVFSDTNIQCDYVHFCSGQDYPIVPPSEFDAKFEDSIEKAWMCISDFEGFRTWHFRVDIYHYSDICHDKKSLLWHCLKLITNIQRVLFKVHVRFRTPLNNKLYGGSSWFSWDKDILKFVVNYLESHPDYEKRFHMTGGADEIFFHYLLFNSEYAGAIKKNNYRYIDWSQGGKNPKVLNICDLSSILTSDNVLIRKVNLAESEELLDSIDREIFNR